MTIYIGYRIFRHVPTERAKVYVTSLPINGAPDYGYSPDRTQAIPMSVYWRRRFEKYVRDCGTNGGEDCVAFVPL